MEPCNDSRRTPRLVSAAVACALLLSACGTGAEPHGIACEGSELTLVREGSLTVGVDPSLPPYAIRDPETGEPDGFEVELLAAVARELGLEPRFLDRSYPALVPGLLAGGYDVAASGIKASQAGEEVCLTSPHLRADLGLLVLAPRAEHVAEPADLDGLAVGVVRGTRGAEWARAELADPGRVETFPTDDDAVAALTGERVAGVVHDLPIAAHRQRIHERVELVDVVSTGDVHAFGVHPRNDPLLERINEALAELHRDGTYEALVEKWFVDDRVVP